MIHIGNEDEEMQGWLATAIDERIWEVRNWALAYNDIGVLHLDGPVSLTVNKFSHFYFKKNQIQ